MQNAGYSNTEISYMKFEADNQSSTPIPFSSKRSEDDIYVALRNVELEAKNLSFREPTAENMGDEDKYY